MQLLALLLFGILKIKMKKIKKFILIVFSITFASQVFAKEVPNSFADLAEKLMPSVVNISTTTTVVTNSNPFPGFNSHQVLLLRICLKNLERHRQENQLL